jgi:integrase
MAAKLPPHVTMVRNGRGHPYYYLQKHRGTARAEGRRRLPDITDKDFWAAYAEAIGLPVPNKNANAIGALIASWQASPEWAAMSGKTQVEWARYCRRVADVLGEFDVKLIEPKHIIALRDKWAATPAAANNLLRCLSTLMRWSVPRGWRPDNPCREVPQFAAGEAYAPWPWEAIEASKIELEAGRIELWWAIALALYTGQRKGDVLAMRWDAIHDGIIAVKQEKTQKRLAVPLHRDLREILTGIPKRAVTVLTSSEGRPWGSGFNASWRKHRPAAAEGLVFHGLRKSAVNTLLECGCSSAETAAVTGQSLNMVEHYAKGVDQARLARTAMARWEAGR